MNLTQKQRDEAKPMPIFIRPLRYAVRNGSKTQTRRILKPQPFDGFHPENDGVAGMYHPTKIDKRTGEMYPGPEVFGVSDADQDFPSPYGRPGDICYLREPLRDANGTAYYYDDDRPVHAPGAEDVMWRWQKPYLTQIHMPKIYARTFCQITGIRVERLQDITEADAKAEGIQIPFVNFPQEKGSKFEVGDPLGSYVNHYSVLWNTINGEDAWKLNPWVWVIQFKKL